MWFYEQRRLGKWHPVKVPEAPETVSVAGKVRLKTACGLGVEIRGLRQIPACLHHLTLRQLAEVYGADGRLQATARSEAVAS